MSSASFSDLLIKERPSRSASSPWCNAFLLPCLAYMHEPMLVLESPVHGADVLKALLDSMTPTWLAVAVLSRFGDLSIWEHLVVQPMQSLFLHSQSYTRDGCQPQSTTATAGCSTGLCCNVTQGCATTGQNWALTTSQSRNGIASLQPSPLKHANLAQKMASIKSTAGSRLTVPWWLLYKNHLTNKMTSLLGFFSSCRLSLGTESKDLSSPHPPKHHLAHNLGMLEMHMLWAHLGACRGYVGYML